MWSLREERKKKPSLQVSRLRKDPPWGGRVSSTEEAVLGGRAGRRGGGRVGRCSAPAGWPPGETWPSPRADTKSGPGTVSGALLQGRLSALGGADGEAPTSPPRLRGQAGWLGRSPGQRNTFPPTPSVVLHEAPLLLQTPSTSASRLT